MVTPGLSLLLKCLVFLPCLIMMYDNHVVSRTTVMLWSTRFFTALCDAKIMSPFLAGDQNCLLDEIEGQFRRLPGVCDAMV